MQVFSHSKLTENGTRKGSKLLLDHLKGVREKAFNHLSDRFNFGETNNVLELLNVICWLHDLGKYTQYFQTYLLEPDKADYHLKAHSNLGAHTAYQYFKDVPETALLAFYLIKMHHANLMNFDMVLFPENSQYIMEEPSIFDKQLKSLNELTELKNQFPNFTEDQIKLSTPNELFRLYKKLIRKAPSIERYYIINYLFSLLIEADKLDASDTTPYSQAPLPENAVDDRPGFGKPRYPEGDLKNFCQNELRNFVRSEVVKNLHSEAILNKKIFTLSAPTGIGKTMTSLDFVLKLRKKIERKEGYLPQVIYGLPFINIIEQALDEYDKTLGKSKIIGHYQYADIFGKDNPEKNSLSDNERFYSQKQMAWDTWQSDVVITSFVQLFETLIGNRNRLLKKFRHFANSIIIIDEVQTLPIEKLPVIGAALYYLCQYLNARVLIMTATQPKIFELMERELSVYIKDESLKPFNLLERENEVFSCFNRTKIVPLINEKIENEDFLKIFKSRWSLNKSCLIVVNKVNRSIDIYNLIKEYIGVNDDVELFYLSTNITPVERKSRIDKIKELLPIKICVLVSTQVIEAGVDLDFDMGFRDLGPIDSIVQVAGRINRENSEAKKGSPLYIIDFGDCLRIYGKGTDQNARKSLTKDEYHEPDYKVLVEKYFENVSSETQSSFQISRDVFNAMKNLDYAFPNSSIKKRVTVCDFRIIEHSQEGVSIFVELPNDKTGTEAREAYQHLLKGVITKHDFDKNYKRAFNQRIIAVPSYLDSIDDLQEEESLSEGILWIKPEESEAYYDMDTGYLRSGKEANQIISF